MNDFDVKKPTKENIDYALKNLLFYVTSSMLLDAYSAQKLKFKNVLVKINNILDIYVNTGKLEDIDGEFLQNIRLDLIDLDTETKNFKSYFAEWSLLWLDAIISLRLVKIEMGDDVNGR